MNRMSYLMGVLFCLIATVSWGIMFPIMTSALKYIDPFTFTALRYFIAGTAFVILLWIKEGRSALSFKGERVLLLWSLGSAGFAGFGFLVFLGQKIAGPSGALTASIMMATMPMLGLLVNWILRKIRPPLFSFGFVLLSFVGVLLVITKGNLADLFVTPQDYSADFLMILGALCWVIYTTGATFFPKLSPFRYTALTTVLGFMTILGVNLTLIGMNEISLPSFGTILSVIPQLLYMALVAGFVGVLSWNWGNKIITPINGVLFMDVVPVTAFFVS